MAAGPPTREEVALPDRRTPPTRPATPGDIDQEVERLSEVLKAQVRRAKDRITDNFGELMQPGGPARPRRTS